MTPRLSAFAEDILRETMNIGGAHAVNALARMADVPIFISLPVIKLSPIENISDCIGPSDAMLSAIVHRIVGDIAGYIILSFSEHDACTLAKHIRAQHTIDEKNACMETLSEMGNVISGSCFASLNRFLGLAFSQSVPDAATDMTGALINSVLAEMGQTTDDALLAQLRFGIEEPAITGTIFLIMDPDSTQRILQAAHRKLHDS